MYFMKNQFNMKANKFSKCAHSIYRTVISLRPLMYDNARENLDKRGEEIGKVQSRRHPAAIMGRHTNDKGIHTGEPGTDYK